jgi:hypothetical protein
MLTLWRNRFVPLKIEGLLMDASRLGRATSISTQTVPQIIEKTPQTKPANTTHWPRSTMAREADGCTNQAKSGHSFGNRMPGAPGL